MKIKDYLYNKQARILFLASFGLLLLIVREVPFLNIFFPENAIPFAISIAAIVLFKWYRSYIFFLILTVAMIIPTFTGSISQAEQLAILIFVILVIFIADQTLSLFKDESYK